MMLWFFLVLTTTAQTRLGPFMDRADCDARRNLYVASHGGTDLTVTGCYEGPATGITSKD